MGKVFKSPIDYFYRQKETGKEMTANTINSIGAARIYIQRKKAPEMVKLLLKSANLSYRSDIIRMALDELLREGLIDISQANSFYQEYAKLGGE